MWPTVPTVDCKAGNNRENVLLRNNSVLPVPSAYSLIINKDHRQSCLSRTVGVKGGLLIGQFQFWSYGQRRIKSNVWIWSAVLHWAGLNELSFCILLIL